jgi:hypothetical protein
MSIHQPNNGENRFSGLFDLVGELLGQVGVDGLIELIGAIVGAFSDC